MFHVKLWSINVCCLFCILAVIPLHYRQQTVDHIHCIRTLIHKPCKVSINELINQSIKTPMTCQPGTILYICYSCSICQFNKYLWFTWTKYQRQIRTTTTGWYECNIDNIWNTSAADSPIASNISNKSSVVADKCYNTSCTAVSVTIINTIKYLPKPTRLPNLACITSTVPEMQMVSTLKKEVMWLRPHPL